MTKTTKKPARTSTPSPAAASSMQSDSPQPEPTNHDTKPRGDGATGAGLEGARVPESIRASALDLAAIRLPQNYAAIGGVRKVLTTVPVRRPDRQSFVRARPGDEWRIQVALIEMREDGESYLVPPALIEPLIEEVRFKQLYLCVTRDGNPFFWPVNLPGPDGRLDPWSQSAHQAAAIAEKNWVRLRSNRTLGAYDVHMADTSPDPVWPQQSLESLVQLAFTGKIIDSLEHRVVHALSGRSAHGV